MTGQLQGVGVAWMRREDWPRWLKLDPLFQPDYNHWLRRVSNALAQLQSQGIPAVKVMIDIDEFLAWGKANGRGVGTLDRSEYVAEKVREMHEREHH